MPLAYYSTAARQEFWTEHWGGHSVEELLAVARASPLTDLVTGALETAGTASGPVLEAGCGLGQYVLLLRERGWRVVGVDWSLEALGACRRVAPAPLAQMELRALGVRDGALGAYVSLGVVEHDPAGPDAILAEARRVLAPGGRLVLSVPYLNGVRRVGAPYLRLQGRRLARRGGEFYQYAFSRRDLTAALARHGFAVRGMRPYDPARLLRRVLPRRRSPEAGAPHAAGGGAPGGRRGGVAGLARRLLYTGPALRLLGHMLLAAAVKR
ncbi:MAG: hypothetical protein A2X36_05000 [Elusimicrobia bacterium GWA2_69_24]|nr:MAG: hypothetical protein A2X52_23215 [Candidatus Rokubacteria bacterium GWC2_70_16]OGK89583.1 MAG: hypothetical protein A2W08_17405 [Candidatus Rokubacteria bacterium RBG_16_73_20]OGR61015.1 MAG: hypothetical protein A2X36_05000 [Elusimicrobia bacterium GWA2_69_24]HBH04905.1 hypothetical protein [Candidatus Rokubacteria bacterium]